MLFVVKMKTQARNSMKSIRSKLSGMRFTCLALWTHQLEELYHDGDCDVVVEDDADMTTQAVIRKRSWAPESLEL